MTTVYVKRDNSLKDLMTNFEAAPTPENRQAIYAVLPHAMIYVGSTLLPEAWLKAATGTTEGHRLPLLTAMGQDGTRAIVAFCDEASVVRADAQLFPICLNATELIRLLLLQNVEALMLKNGEYWIGITREELQRLPLG